MDDDNPSPGDVSRIESRLEVLGIRRDFHRYVGAGHAFQNFLREPAFREGAAKDSWNRTLMFLEDHLA